MIKGSVQGETITVVNMHAPNTGTPNYIKQILTDTKAEIDNYTVIVGDLTTHLPDYPRRKINKETVVLDTIDQLDLIDIYRKFYPKRTEQTFFSSVHGTFSRIYHSHARPQDLS